MTSSPRWSSQLRLEEGEDRVGTTHRPCAPNPPIQPYAGSMFDDITSLAMQRVDGVWQHLQMGVCGCEQVGSVGKGEIRVTKIGFLHDEPIGRGPREETKDVEAHMVMLSEQSFLLGGA